MCFAPAVSIEYWQEVAERHAKYLEQKNDESVTNAYLISNNCDKAVQMMAQNKEYEDGKLIKAMQLTGGFRSILDKLKSK